MLERFNVGYVKDWRHPSLPDTIPAGPRLIIPTGKYSYLARDTTGTALHPKMRVGKQDIFNAEALTAKTDKPIFITEGEIDAMSIIDVGFEAVALGSLGNIRQLDKIKCNRPLVAAFDSDEAGQRAAGSLSLPYRLSLGGYKDANEALMADRAGLTRAVALQAEYVEGIQAAKRDWAGFLACAGRNYKHNFDEQVMIYKQKPNATACAAEEVWEKLGRKVAKIRREFGF